MATPAEYVAAQNGAVRLAQRDLRRTWRNLDLSDPVAAREALERIWPELIATYGEATVTLAADRFEELTDLPATPVRPVDPERANERMRWGVGPLFGESGDALVRLLQLADELVKQPGRSTMARSAEENNIRFARVPNAGACKFCTMLGSRGAVYRSRESAGQISFHPDCNCRIEPVASQADIDRLRDEGYDPDELKNKWADMEAGRIPDTSTRDKPIADMDMAELESKMEDAMTSGDFALAEALGAELDGRFYTDSGARLDPRDPFNDATYEWFEAQDRATRDRFYDTMSDRSREQFSEAQWSHMSGRNIRTLPTKREMRREFDDWLDNEWIRAEESTNGNMLSRSARASGVAVTDLWKVNATTARAWASEELLDYWNQNGRMTFADWEASYSSRGESTARMNAGMWLQ